MRLSAEQVKQAALDSGFEMAGVVSAGAVLRL